MSEDSQVIAIDVSPQVVSSARARLAAVLSGLHPRRIAASKQ